MLGAKDGGALLCGEDNASCWGRLALESGIASAMLHSMNASDLISVNPNVLGGTPVFGGTRVPVRSLFEYLEDNYTLDEFLECFPSVTREMALGILDRSEKTLLQSAA
jgi:uncharacterized protein (DUF433 family)